MTLARLNQRELPSILRSYIFPDEDEIRLVHVDSQALGGDNVVHAIQFSPDLSEGITYSSRIALVPVRDESTAALPASWGDWSSAKVLERETRSQKAS